MNKICFKCFEEKPLSEFYQHKGMGDGYLGKCKECTKEDTKQTRLNNLEYYKEYDKNRANLPHRVDARKKYQQTENGKEAMKRSRDSWIKNNLIKRAASQLVNNAIRDKKLEKKNYCEVCGDSESRIHGHHDDYAYPLVVRWLCPKCHSNWHKEHGSAING